MFNVASLLFRQAPPLSLGWTFLYLLFFRMVTWFGLSSPTPFANAIQLLLTLKVSHDVIIVTACGKEGRKFRNEGKQETSVWRFACVCDRWSVWHTRCRAITLRRKRKSARSPSRPWLAVSLVSPRFMISSPTATAMPGSWRVSMFVCNFLCYYLIKGAIRFNNICHVVYDFNNMMLKR